MNIEPNRLKEMITAAYDHGYWRGGDKEEYLANVLAGFDTNNDEEGFRIWTVAELREMPEGAAFEHSRFGSCRIAVNRGEKFMLFDSTVMYMAGFTIDGHPWDQVMRRLPA